jgi:hypothetical protein
MLGASASAALVSATSLKLNCYLPKTTLVGEKQVLIKKADFTRCPFLPLFES